MELFCYLREDNIAKTTYENINAHAESNSNIYNIIKNKEFMYESFNNSYSLISLYLKNEIQDYIDLIKSPYFLSL